MSREVDYLTRQSAATPDVINEHRRRELECLPRSLHGSPPGLEYIVADAHEVLAELESEGYGSRLPATHCVLLNM